MPVTKIDVINRVLNELGKGAVANAADDPAATLIDLRITQFLPQLLQQNIWVWNLKYRQDSTPITPNPAPLFQYAYQLPADYGRMANVWNNAPSAYLIIDGVICTNANTIDYYYCVNAAVFENNNYSGMSPLFIDALVLFVAYRVAAVLTNNEGLVQYLAREQKTAMDSAVMFNIMETQCMGAPYNDFNRIVLI